MIIVKLAIFNLNRILINMLILPNLAKSNPKLNLLFE